MSTALLIKSVRKQLTPLTPASVALVGDAQVAVILSHFFWWQGQEGGWETSGWLLANLW